VTSSQPVVTQNAINFTPDNKRAYAYSGLTEVTDTRVTLIEFDTNSEYLLGKVQFMQGEYHNDKYEYRIYFNDIQITTIIKFGPGDTNGEAPNYYPVLIIVPPFTNVKMTAENVENTNGNKQIANFVGKAIGMTETGYQ